MPNTAVARDADAVFAAGLATLGSGFSQLFLIDCNEIGDWVRTTVTGGFAHAVVGAIDHFLRDVIAMPPDQASLCFVCDTQLVAAPCQSWWACSCRLPPRRRVPAASVFAVVAPAGRAGDRRDGSSTWPSLPFRGSAKSGRIFALATLSSMSIWRAALPCRRGEPDEAANGF